MYYSLDERKKILAKINSDIEQEKSIIEMVEALYVTLKINKNERISTSQTVKLLGGQIEHFDNAEDEVETVLKSDDNSFIIRIYRNLSVEHRRITIARYLAILFLHMGYQTEKWDKVQSYVDELRVTNHYKTRHDEFTFALNFLMPADVFENKFAEACEEEDRIKKIAEFFQLEEEFIERRGRDLGLLD